MLHMRASTSSKSTTRTRTLVDAEQFQRLDPVPAGDENEAAIALDRRWARFAGLSPRSTAIARRTAVAL